jgi:hypothetical protein
MTRRLAIALAGTIALLLLSVCGSVEHNDADAGGTCVWDQSNWDACTWAP